MSAVIDKAAFKSIKDYIDFAKGIKRGEIITGGKCDDSKGYFIEPTQLLQLILNLKTMQEEIFGPVLTIYVYEDNKFDETLVLCDQTSPYALTGAIWAKDRDFWLKCPIN